ncbi:portal protein, partial [bacterium]|nr:portal protein [bacterium]
MNKFRNKIVYDAATGEVRDNRRHMSMMEDFWMPRREGGKGTEITTLPGGQNLGQIEDINYFQNKLYQSLNVPVSRLQPQQGFTLGRSTEISRDEIKFNKFINRLRKKFSSIFYDTLRVQLIAKGIIRADEWEELSTNISFDFESDNHFTELKNNEIIQQRLNALQLIDPYVGKYYSINFVRKNVLMQNEEEMKEIDKEIKDEQKQMMDHAELQGQLAQAQQGE